MTEIIDPITMRPNDAYTSSPCQMCMDLNKNGIIMVEIGVYRGEGTRSFLSSGRIAKIYSIDPWQNGYDESDIASRSNMTLVESEFDKLVSSNDGIIVKCKGVIDDFVDKITEDVDFVYIDANHQYETVKHDIETVMKKLRPKIAIGGHDYSDEWRGVVRAVDEIFTKPDKTYPDTSWIKFI